MTASSTISTSLSSYFDPTQQRSTVATFYIVSEVSLGVVTTITASATPDGSNNSGVSSTPSGTSSNCRTCGSAGSPPNSTGNPTTTSTGTSEPTPTPNSGLSTGAIAGIAIACVLVGLVLGAIAAFLFLSRRRKRQSRSAVVPTQYGDSSYERKAPIVTTTPAAAENTQLSQFLLAAKPDTELAGELRNLSQLIQLHVENNYHSGPVQTTAASLSEALVDLGFGGNSTVDPARLSALAIDPRTRQVALQHVISQVVFGSVVVTNGSGISVLPASIAAFVRDMAPVERHRGSPDAVSRAFTRWRQLSAFLLHPNRSERTALPVDSEINKRAIQLVNQLSLFLWAFVDPKYKAQQESHLQGVIVECAKFGNILLSQPNEYRLRFVSAQDFELVICPGLDKFGDEQGNALKPTQQVLAPAVATV